MAVDKADIKSDYPLPVYNYRVTILDDGEASVIGFAEVAGLDLEYEPVSYKHGLSFLMGSYVIPGMRQPIRLTLKRGVVKNDKFLYSWLRDTYSLGLVKERRNILIDLCDEAGEPVIRWKVRGALPIKLEAPTFDADSNEVAIESMELAAHNLQVEYNP